MSSWIYLQVHMLCILTFRFKWISQQYLFSLQSYFTVSYLHLLHINPIFFFFFSVFVFVNNLIFFSFLLPVEFFPFPLPLPSPLSLFSLSQYLLLTLLLLLYSTISLLLFIFHPSLHLVGPGFESLCRLNSEGITAVYGALGAVAVRAENALMFTQVLICLTTLNYNHSSSHCSYCII